MPGGVNAPAIPAISTPGIDASLPQGLGELKTPDVIGDVGQVSEEIKGVQDKINTPPTKDEVPVSTASLA